MDEKSVKFKGSESTVSKKKKWLKMFEECIYHIENTCKKMNMIKSEFYRWKVNDRAFFDEFEKIRKNAVTKGMIRERKRTEIAIETEELKLMEKWLTLYSGGKMSPDDVCEKLKVTKYRLKLWKRDCPEFLEKLNTLVTMKRRKHAIATIKSGKGYKAANKMAISLRKRRQKIWLKVFKRTKFNVKEACDAAGIKRMTYYSWKKKYPKFLEAYETALEEKKDFIEDKLMKNIEGGDSSCIIFAAKTQLKDRGYIEKQEIEHSGNFGVMVVPGKIEDAHDWAAKAQKQQQLLNEKSMETDYIHELQE